MEINTELILLSSDISDQVTLQQNNLVSSRFYLLSNINNLIILKSSFLRGCMIPRLDIRNSMLIKYYGVIPRLAYKLISIGKRFFFFNNKFLSMKK